MSPDAADRQEIARLTAEVERLRALERRLSAERERVRAEPAAEIARLQEALRQAAGHARGLEPDSGAGHELAERARYLAERERLLGEQAATLAVGEQELAAEKDRLARERRALTARRGRLEAEQRRLADEWKRLEEESGRLAEWEREALAGGISTPLPTTFREGLQRLAKPSTAPRAPSSSSW
jgi:chromosome segregation ATPase